MLHDFMELVKEEFNDPDLDEDQKIPMSQAILAYLLDNQTSDADNRLQAYAQTVSTTNLQGKEVPIDLVAAISATTGHSLPQVSAALVKGTYILSSRANLTEVVHGTAAPLVRGITAHGLLPGGDVVKGRNCLFFGMKFIGQTSFAGAGVRERADVLVYIDVYALRVAIRNRQITLFVNPKNALITEDPLPVFFILRMIHVPTSRTIYVRPPSRVAALEEFLRACELEPNGSARVRDFPPPGEETCSSDEEELFYKSRSDNSEPLVPLDNAYYKKAYKHVTDALGGAGNYLKELRQQAHEADENREQIRHEISQGSPFLRRDQTLTRGGRDVFMTVMSEQEALGHKPIQCQNCKFWYPDVPHYELAGLQYCSQCWVPLCNRAMYDWQDRLPPNFREALWWQQTWRKWVKPSSRGKDLDPLAGFTNPDELGEYMGARPGDEFPDKMRQELASMGTIEQMVREDRKLDDPAGQLVGVDENDMRLGHANAVKTKMRNCSNAVGTGHAQRWDEDPVYRLQQRSKGIPRVLMYKSSTSDMINVPDLAYLRDHPNDPCPDEINDLSVSGTWDEDTWKEQLETRRTTGLQRIDPDYRPAKKPRARWVPRYQAYHAWQGRYGPQKRKYRAASPDDRDPVTGAASSGINRPEASEGVDRMGDDTQYAEENIDASQAASNDAADEVYDDPVPNDDHWDQHRYE